VSCMTAVATAGIQNFGKRTMSLRHRRTPWLCARAGLGCLNVRNMQCREFSAQSIEEGSGEVGFGFVRGRFGKASVRYTPFLRPQCEQSQGDCVAQDQRIRVQLAEKADTEGEMFPWSVTSRGVETRKLPLNPMGPSLPPGWEVQNSGVRSLQALAVRRTVVVAGRATAVRNIHSMFAFVLLFTFSSPPGPPLQHRICMHATAWGKH